MFEQDPELSSDLDWMLQSGQVSSDELAEALVSELYAQVSHLAHSILDDAEAARLATLETFSTAVLNVYRYRGKTGVKDWVAAIAIDVCWGSRLRLEAWQAMHNGSNDSKKPPESPQKPPASRLNAAIWQAVDSLDEPTRLLVILQHLHGWAAAEIAAARRQKETFVLARLSTARWKILHSIHKAGLFIEDANRQDFLGQDFDAQLARSLDPQLARSLRARWPAPVVSAEETQGVISEVKNLVNQRGARRRRAISFQEALLVGLAILFAGGLIWGSNAFFPEPEPTRAVRVVRETAVQVVPVTLTPTPRSLAARPPTTPTPTATDSPTPTVTPTPTGVFYTVQEGDTLDSVAAGLGVLASDLSDLNRLPPGFPLQTGQALVIPSRLTPGPTPTPVPVTPTPRPPPLTSASTSNEIRQQLEDLAGINSGHNLWFDAQIAYFRPQGYSGPVQTYRVQGWMSAQRFLLASGPVDGLPEEVLLTTGEQFYIASPGRGLHWFVEPREDAILYSSAYESLFSVFFMSSERLVTPMLGTFEIAGREQVTGRPAFFIDYTNLYGHKSSRIWVDAQTGLLLRQQHFDSSPEQKLLKEVRITAVEYDIDFPLELFDPRLPWRGGFARDATGRPDAPAASLPDWMVQPESTSLPLMRAIPGFDASNSYLRFGFPPDYNRSARAGLTDLSGPQVDLFVDGFYLSSIEFADPFNLACARSPNGQWIAFAETFWYPLPNRASLHWLSLRDHSQVHSLPDDLYASDFAFAPDSRHLAFIGYDRPFEAGIYILDVASDEIRPVMSRLPLPMGISLAWSPDGEYLAAVALSNSQEANFLEQIVLRADNGQVVDQQSVQHVPGSPVEWPPLPWEGEFPVQMGGLETCASPP